MPRKSLDEIFASNAQFAGSPGLDGKPSLDDIFKFGSSPSAPIGAAKAAPGFIQGAVQSAAKPFARLAVSLARAGKGIKELVSGTPDSRKSFEENVGAPADLGYLGKITPFGYDDKGNRLSTVQGLKQTAGTAAEVASYAIGGGSVASATKSLGKGALLRATGKAALGSAASGAVGQGGAALSGNPSASFADVASEAGKGFAVGGTIGAVTAGIPAMALSAKRTISPDAEEAIFRAIKPKKTNTRFREDLRSALPEIVRAGGKPIKTIEEFNTAINTAKKNVWSHYKSVLGPNAKLEIDGEAIADAIEQTITKRFELQNPSAADRIRAIAKTYRRKLTAEEAEDFLQSANNDLHSYYAKNKVSQKVAAADPDVAYVLKEAEGLRTSLYSVLEKASGQNVAALKRLWGALTNVEEESVGRAIVAARQAPFSLAEQVSFASALGDIAKSALNLELGDALKGTGKLVGGKLLRDANETDTLLRRGLFKATKKFKP